MPNIQIKKIIPASRKYKGFTLIEMVVVMGIAVILIGLSMDSFGGFRTEMLLTQAVYNISQDIRTAQRSSMFVTRDINDKWLYGVGIDLQNYNTTKQYKVFKWCSQFDEYDQNGDPRLRSELPNWNPSQNFNISGNAKITSVYSPSCSCDKNGSVSSVTCLEDVSGYMTEKLDQSFIVTIEQINGRNPRYILFEAVSGRTFFYDSNGELLNYTYGGPGVVNFSSNPQSLVIKIEAPSGSTRKVYIEPVSGRIKTE